MRQPFNPQLQLGEVPVSAISLDLDSRDDIPKVLRGLQQLHEDRKARDAVLGMLATCLPKEVDQTTGRMGMDYWTIFVLGVLRLALNCDYDRIAELANEHRTLREMLGHGLLDEDKRYGRTTILENVSLITPEVLEKVNVVLVMCGHSFLGQTEAALRGRCDSFVLETDIHYPTDASILLDAMRRLLKACNQANEVGISGWRQYKHLYKELRKIYLRALRLCPSKAQDESKVEARRQLIREICQLFLARALALLESIEVTLKELKGLGKEPKALALQEEIEKFLPHAYRQVDQMRRRVILGERIPHDEKVFSVFEEYSEWINKGKAGVPVELGVRVAIVEDQFQFILHHRVMLGETDDKVPVEIIQNTKANFPNFRACSFDKGFYTASNLSDLGKSLELVVLPKKGKWSEQDRERETADEFVAMRRQHAAVESAINALEVHGLDRCLDHGLHGFKRYVAWAVVGRNLLRLGAIALEKDREKKLREERTQIRRQNLSRQQRAA